MNSVNQVRDALVLMMRDHGIEGDVITEPGFILRVNRFIINIDMENVDNNKHKMNNAADDVNRYLCESVFQRTGKIVYSPITHLLYENEVVVIRDDDIPGEE
jgi:hypothetical protein